MNAKFHEKEAMIIAEAGRPGAITIATNMAGRGTDIVLGGKQEEHDQDWEEKHNQVIEAGGLHVIGTERHESRRIDNQLRGRSGRQGDPGRSKFLLSLKKSNKTIVTFSNSAMIEEIADTNLNLNGI